MSLSREPTQAMEMAGWSVIQHYREDDSAPSAKQVWQAMYDAAGTTPSADSVYEAIKHGGMKHREWLKAALVAHFAGEPVPPAVLNDPLPTPAAPLGAEDAELPLRSMSTHLLTATQLTGAELIHIANALDKVADRIAALSAQVAAGEADRRQLDWLDRDDISIEFAVDPDTGKSIVSIDSLGTRSKELACENTLREAIDTAIASSAAQRKGEPWPAT